MATNRLDPEGTWERGNIYEPVHDKSNKMTCAPRPQQKL